MKRWSLVVLILAAVIVSVTVVVLVSQRWPEASRTVRCSDFRTQPSAQARYLSDPIAYRHLDSDFDSVACETLPKR